MQVSRQKVTFFFFFSRSEAEQRDAGTAVTTCPCVLIINFTHLYKWSTGAKVTDAAGDEGETSDGAVESADTPAGLVDLMTAPPCSEVAVDTWAKNRGLRASFQVKFSHPAIWTTVLSTTSGHWYHLSPSYIAF